MSKNQHSDSVVVPKYKECKIKWLSYLIAAIYLIFVCVPVFIVVYTSMKVAFLLIDINSFYKKTIKYAKAKCQSKSPERLS